MAMCLVNKETQKRIRKGATVTDFLGRKWVVKDIIAKPTIKVLLEDSTEGVNATREFYPSFIGAEVQPERKK